jgi:hypothetical protein
MYQKPIFLSQITYSVRRYASRRGEIVLQKKVETFTSDEVCVGGTLEDCQNKKYNSYLIGRLRIRHSKTYSCEVEILNAIPIVQCGMTTKRFKH